MALQDLISSNLSETQILGIRNYGLSLAQVRTEEFGMHTLEGIQTLLRENRASGNQDAFQVLQEMNAAQTRGIVQFFLSREQVLSPGFSEDIINHIPLLRLHNSALTTQEAFESLVNLHPERLRILRQEQQNSGIVTPRHILFGIQNLQLQDQDLTYGQALEQLRGLNQFQVLGITNLNLTRAQVEVENFGQHTIDGIHQLQSAGQEMSILDAYNHLKGLRYVQVRGITQFNLTRDQVLTPDYGRHSLTTMQVLRQSGRARNWQHAFELVHGLNDAQARGIRDFALERSEVTTTNFGIHTLRGMEELRSDAVRRGSYDFSFHDAFCILEGLNAIQVNGITDFELTREQVLQPQYNEVAFITMQSLRRHHPEANNSHLYEMALGLPEYQIRGLTKFGLHPEQLGLSFQDDHFVQIYDKKEPIASGVTVDAISHLVFTENMNPEQAYHTAIALDITQVIALVDFGLHLNQVQHAIFKESEGILDLLLKAATDESGELELPLWPDDQKNAREIMAALLLDTIITETDERKEESKEEYSKAQNDQVLDNTDIDEFLSYAYNRDVLGIFDGIQQSIQQLSLQEEKASWRIPQQHQIKKKDNRAVATARSGNLLNNEDLKSNLYALAVPVTLNKNRTQPSNQSDSDDRKPAAYKKNKTRRPGL